MLDIFIVMSIIISRNDLGFPPVIEAAAGGHLTKLGSTVEN